MFPVVLHHACASRENPASVATISIRSPSPIESIACLIFMTGPGHCNPQASIFKVFIRSPVCCVSVLPFVLIVAVLFSIGAVAVA